MVGAVIIVITYGVRAIERIALILMPALLPLVLLLALYAISLPEATSGH
jgi:SNF family Na+-dependent transporter